MSAIDALVEALRHHKAAAKSSTVAPVAPTRGDAKQSSAAAGAGDDDDGLNVIACFLPGGLGGSSRCTVRETRCCCFSGILSALLKVILGDFKLVPRNCLYCAG